MLVVVRLSPVARNVPQRTRGNHKFNHQPKLAEVTANELNEIHGDPFLKICNFPSVAWFEAFGFERTQINEDKYRQNPPLDIPASAVLAQRIGEVPEELLKKEVSVAEDQPEQSAEPEQGPDPEQRPEQYVEEMTKAQIIAKLEAKGQTAGKDFDKKAKKDALISLLKSL